MEKNLPLFRMYDDGKFDHYFPALWLFAVLLKLLAWLSVPIGLVILFSRGPSPPIVPPLPLVLLTVSAAAVAGFLLWVLSDLVKLLLCLEHNTRRND
jgi:hypothetical protein